jgi:hypothetical protein
MHSIDIEGNIQKFLQGTGRNDGLQPTERYASFDYCFNYFQSFRERRIIEQIYSPENIQNSCLHLCFYLASWGMLRGSCPLLQKSIKFYIPLIEYLATAPKKLWEIDVDCYTREDIQLLRDCRKKISYALLPCGASDTLATKIMLGVFGNVPAFDSAFKLGIRVSNFGTMALEKISAFYQENKDIIDRFRMPTLDFLSGRHTERLYTRAKVIDMVFFIEGS